MVVALLGLVAVVLFAAAGGGAFAATRTLAKQPLLPTRSPATSTPPSQVSVPQLSTVTTAATVVADGADGSGGKFSVPVPDGWTQFIEERKAHDNLPPSAAVRWVEPDGSAELTVERFLNYPTGKTTLYLDALQPNDASHNLQCTPKTGACKIYLYRANDTNRSTYFSFVTAGSDLWVVSVTVPLDKEGTAMLTLFTQITAGFSVSS
jgi:hypothetical protein